MSRIHCVDAHPSAFALRLSRTGFDSSRPRQARGGRRRVRGVEYQDGQQPNGGRDLNEPPTAPGWIISGSRAGSRTNTTRRRNRSCVRTGISTRATVRAYAGATTAPCCPDTLPPTGDVPIRRAARRTLCRLFVSGRNQTLRKPLHDRGRTALSRVNRQGDAANCQIRPGANPRVPSLAAVAGRCPRILHEADVVKRLRAP